MPSLSEILDNKKTVFIGSSPENDLVLNDPQTSPIHCQISKVKKGVYMVVDLESDTGTYINDKRVIKEFAGEYDKIKIGNNVFDLNSEPSQPVSQPNFAFGSQASKSTAAAHSRPEEPAFEKVEVEDSGPTLHRIPGNQGSAKQQITVYFLAAPEDEETCEAVYKHLSTIRFASPLPVEILGDFRMTGGEEVGAYRGKITTADIVLAFVSVDFLNNNDCYERLKTVIGNHNQGKAILLPILVRNCMWKTTPFANLPLLPKNHQPLNNKHYWNSEDDALTNVADDIYQAISKFTQNRKPEEPLSVTANTTLKTNWRGTYLWKNFWKRTAAYLLDILIIILPAFFVLYLALGESFTHLTQESTILLSLIDTVLLILVYSYFDSSRWRGTPGKHIMKLQITDQVGNPISFAMALKRNTFKFFIFGFVGGLDSSGAISLLICIGQVGCYAATRKFIHDYLSNTVIGERTKTEATAAPPTAAQAGTVNGGIPAGKPAKSMAPTIAGIITLCCIILFFIGKNIAENNVEPSPVKNNLLIDPSEPQPEPALPSPTELTNEKRASLITAINYGNQTEMEAFQKLDESILARAFKGEKLRESRTSLAQYIEQRLYQVSQLESQQFNDFKLTDGGKKAEVNVTETWSTVVYSADTYQCQGRYPSHAVSQTIYLEQVDGVWMVYNIIFDRNTPQPNLAPCE